MIGQGIGQALGYPVGGQYPSGLPGVTEMRQAEVPSQFERLEMALATCQQGLDALSARLENSVMRSESPKESNPTPRAIAATKLGSRTQDATDLALLVSERIQSMTARLEV